MIFELQRQAIFPTHAVGAPGPLPRGAERLTVETADGDTLHGVHIPAKAPRRSPRTLILGFGGNAWNAQDAATYLHELYPNCELVVFHYRGYRPSTGTPSAEALLADAALVHDFAVDRVKPKRVVAVGFSIGTGVAAAVAEDRPVDGLILVTPFDSLKAVARGMFPMLPMGPLFRHEMDAGAALAKAAAPVALIAAERDDLILPARTDGLRDQVRNLAFDRTIAGVGHNDIYQSAAFRKAMHEALDAVLAAG